MPSTATVVQPPPKELQAKVSQEPLKSMDVVQVKLGGDNTATLTQSYQVAADGTIELTGYGKVELAGKTVEQAQQAIYQTLEAASAAEQAIELSRSEYYLVSVAADGSRNLTRHPYREGIRVKEAVNDVKDLDHKVLWIARSSPGRTASDHLLPIDWEAVSRGGSQTTNYKLQAGDWLFVAEEPAQGMARLYGAVTGVFTARPEAAAR
jgi:protein involved in polysaccharide export with SLBB domain